MVEVPVRWPHDQEEDQVEVGIPSSLRMILVAGLTVGDILPRVAVTSCQTMTAAVQEAADMRAVAPLGLAVGF